MAVFTCSFICSKEQSLKLNMNMSFKKKKYEFPSDLLGFGYQFNSDGRLVNANTGESYQFIVKKDNEDYNQQHYDALGEIVTEHVYHLLENDCKLKRLYVPVGEDGGDDSDNRTFIFVSEDFEINFDKLLILIHGSGVVRAGQWSRRLCMAIDKDMKNKRIQQIHKAFVKLIINDSLDSGTQIPFIKKGQEEGFAILVMNTNDNYRIGKDGRKCFIKKSSTSEDHAIYVWKTFISSKPFKKIAVIAHSYGGIITTHLVSQNWVSSKLRLNEPLHTESGDVPRVSAGVTQHAMTSCSSFESIFEFLKKRLQHTERTCFQENI